MTPEQFRTHLETLRALILLGALQAMLTAALIITVAMS